MKTKTITIILAYIVAFSVSSNADTYTNGLFEIKYKAWRKRMSEDILVWSTRCSEFGEIMELGPKYLPDIIRKMESDPDAYILDEAVSSITGIYFIQNNWPEGTYPKWTIQAKMCVYWWNEGRFKTDEKFDAFYLKWLDLKKESKQYEADEVKAEIRRLGIPVLEKMVSVLDESPEFITVFLYLTNLRFVKAAELPETATAEQCRAWWEENKAEFELPPLEVAPAQKSESAPAPTYAPTADSDKKND